MQHQIPENLKPYLQPLYDKIQALQNKNELLQAEIDKINLQITQKPNTSKVVVSQPRKFQLKSAKQSNVSPIPNGKKNEPPSKHVKTEAHQNNVSRVQQKKQQKPQNQKQTKKPPSRVGPRIPTASTSKKQQKQPIVKQPKKEQKKSTATPIPAKKSVNPPSNQKKLTGGKKIQMAPQSVKVQESKIEQSDQVKHEEVKVSQQVKQEKSEPKQAVKNQKKESVRLPDAKVAKKHAVRVSKEVQKPVMKSSGKDKVKSVSKNDKSLEKKQQKQQTKPAPKQQSTINDAEKMMLAESKEEAMVTQEPSFLNQSEVKNQGPVIEVHQFQAQKTEVPQQQAAGSPRFEEQKNQEVQTSKHSDP